MIQSDSLTLQIQPPKSRNVITDVEESNKSGGRFDEAFEVLHLRWGGHLRSSWLTEQPFAQHHSPHDVQGDIEDGGCQIECAGRGRIRR